jgi:hypothetical protein
MTRHTVDTIRGSRPEVDTRPEVDIKSNQGLQDRGHEVNQSVVGDTEPTERSTLDQRECRHEVDARSSESLRKGSVVTKSTQKELLSPSQQEVITQWTGGGCRHLVDQRGVVFTKSTRDSQQVNQRELSSPSRQEGDCCPQVNRKRRLLSPS